MARMRNTRRGTPNRRSGANSRGITGRSNTVPQRTNRIPGRKIRSRNTRLGGVAKYATGKFRNKRQLKIETTKLREELGNLQVEEPVRDRPVDLYTNIYANVEVQTGDKFETNDNAVSFDSEQKLNELYNAGTTIISDENKQIDWLKTKLYIPVGRVCLERGSAMEILDRDFVDLDQKHMEKPQTAPGMDQYDVANIYRTYEDGRMQKLGMTDHGRAHVLDLLGRNKDPNSFKFSIRANHHFIAVINAYNWIDQNTDEIDREGITYKWLFTAGDENYEKRDIDKIVSTSRILSIENIQREHIGTYTCQVENKYGKNWAFPIDLDVERPGEVREVRLTVTNPNGEESEILTNQYEWIPNDASDEHDEKVTMYDNKQMYSVVDDDWYALYWQQSNELWYKDEDNRPWDAEDMDPERGESFEDADEPGELGEDRGYRA